MNLSIGLGQMRSILLALLAFAALVVPAQGQIKISPEYASGQPVIFSVSYPDAPEGAVPTDLIWVLSSEAGYEVRDATSIAVWPVYGANAYTLKVMVSGPLVSAEGKYLPGSNRSFEATTKILGINPDVNPNPKPDVVPVPDGVAPIPDPGFRVMIVYESSKSDELPDYVYHADFRAYLSQVCAKGPDGKTPEFRIVDPQLVTAPTSALWAKAMARERKSLPWIVVSNGKNGFEGPLPKTKAETLALLAKYEIK